MKTKISKNSAKNNVNIVISTLNKNGPKLYLETKFIIVNALKNAQPKPVVVIIRIKEQKTILPSFFTCEIS